jgi:hypothetical protein
LVEAMTGDWDRLLRMVHNDLENLLPGADCLGGLLTKTQHYLSGLMVDQAAEEAGSAKPSRQQPWKR